MAVTRTLEFEIDEAGVAVLEVGAALEAHDTEVVVEEIAEITLKIQLVVSPFRTPVSRELTIDPIRGFGLGLRDWLTSEFEARFAEDWQRIATESRERYCSQLDDQNIAYRKEHREAS